ncbi:hypothetical protein WKW50_19170 [Ochrobactrum sp. GPK 3]|uniref:hypothetical protein n=1 Tax=Brucella sp. 22210 TaxID=3453892 RepID=UPI0031384D60
MSAFQNLSYKLSRSQGITLNTLLILFMFMSVIWFILDWLQLDFPMEPLVVFVGGLATLFASYWPWKPKYRSQRLHGRVITNYMSNNQKYVIGSGDTAFTIQWSNAGASSIHIYSDPSDIDSIAIADGANSFSEIKDASRFDFSNRARTPKEGEIAVVRNMGGFYALIHIHDIRATSHNDDRDEITFSYVINPQRGADFS